MNLHKNQQSINAIKGMEPNWKFVLFAKYYRHYYILDILYIFINYLHFAYFSLSNFSWMHKNPLCIDDLLSFI